MSRPLPLSSTRLLRALSFFSLLGVASCTTLDATGTSSDDALSAGDDQAEHTSAPASIEVRSLGGLVPDTAFSFDVPRGAIGFTLTVLANDPDVVVRSLVSPTGHVAVTDGVPESGTRAIGRGSRGAASVAYPASTASLAGDAVVPGRWTAVVHGPVSAPVSLRVQNTGDGRFHGGALDLDVYVPRGLFVHDPEPVHALDTDTIARDACLERRVAIFYSMLERLVGIRRGAVRYYAIDERYRSATTGDARAALLSAPSTRHPGLAVVLTNDMSYGGGDPLLGYSVGLPGLVDGFGLPQGAIAVALNKGSDATNDALTLLHELGHFTGLMHTTDPDSEDLLADTPTCSKGQTPCADETNLMAFSGPSGGLTLSPSQVRIMQASPFYRATRASATGTTIGN